MFRPDDDTTKHAEDGIDLDYDAAHSLAGIEILDAAPRLSNPQTLRQGVCANDPTQRNCESGKSGRRSGYLHQQISIRGQNRYARRFEITIMRNQCQSLPFAQLCNDLVIEVRTASGKIVEKIIHVQRRETALDS